jgi:hypothetical protein
MWPDPDADLLDAAAQAGPWRHAAVLLAASLLTGAGQLILVRLTSANGIKITEAIWFKAGRLPARDRQRPGGHQGRQSDEQRRLLVACGAAAGLSAAYGVPLGGVLALRLVLPAVMASLIATAVAWVALPDVPTYLIPAYISSTPIVFWAPFAGPIAGLALVG